MSALRRKFISYMDLKGYSKRTKDTYLYMVCHFARYFNRSPEVMGEDEIQEYLLYLIKQKKLSDSTVRQCYCALKLLYEKALRRKWVMENIPMLKKPKLLPTILDKSEVNHLLNSVSNIKHRAIFTVLYSAGLRLSEATNLKVDDIDSKRMLIRIRKGKGEKEFT